MAETSANILIIEDEEETASVIETTLQGLGYNVYRVLEPREGIALLSDTEFAAVITETRSAKMNGIEVTRAVQRACPETNVIVLTFYSFISSAIEAMEAGAYGYITKPLNISEIRIVTQRAVERFFLLSANADKDYYAQLVVQDGLTGLYNRRYFNELMTLEFSKLNRSQDTLSLLMIDVDDFKKYNDTNGHPAGDKLLKDAAQVFGAAVRDVDSVCRYGGEEFAILLPQADKDDAALVAERLRAQVNLYLGSTISIGIASSPADAQEAKALIDKADAALYQAKQTGKNKFCLA